MDLHTVRSGTRKNAKSAKKYFLGTFYEVPIHRFSLETSCLISPPVCSSRRLETETSMLLMSEDDRDSASNSLSDFRNR